MSTNYYLCRKQEHVRSVAIADYIERVRKNLRGFLKTLMPSDLKDDNDLVDALQEAISPMCHALKAHIGYDPLVHLCTSSQSRIIL